MNSRIIHSLFSSVLLMSCAQLGTPTGGPKDIAPPMIISANPPNQSTEFRGKSVDISFNEYIKLDNLKQQLLISPPMKENPEVTVNGKTLSIKWKEELKDNTTYVFSFGKAITDMTEGNAIPDFKYIFSTGQYLDSIQVVGHVLDAFTGDSLENQLVLLYKVNGISPEEWDSLPNKQLPDYFGRTGKGGEYSITNIRQGDYKAIALEDGNANYLYDLPTEAIAFLDSVFTPEDSTTLPPLLRFLPVQDHKFLKARAVVSGQVDFTFSNHAEWAEVELLSPQFKKDEFYSMVIAHDTLRWFFEWGEVDSLIFLVSDAKAPSGMSYRDSVVVKPRQNLKKPLLRYSHSVMNGFLEKGDSLILLTNIPLLSVNNGHFTLIQNEKDTLTVVSNSSIEEPNKIIIPIEFTYQKSFVLTLAPGALTDVFGNTNIHDTIRFKTRQETDYGTLILHFEHEQHNKLISLVNSKKETIRQLYATGDKAIKWGNLLGGDGRIQIIEDQNGNQMWDTGNYWKKIQPERVYYYPEKIQIRPNWEIEIKINQNQKEE